MSTARIKLLTKVVFRLRLTVPAPKLRGLANLQPTQEFSAVVGGFKGGGATSRSTPDSARKMVMLPITLQALPRQLVDELSFETFISLQLRQPVIGSAVCAASLLGASVGLISLWLDVLTSGLVKMIAVAPVGHVFCTSGARA